MIGQIVGGQKLLSKLGEGGMGVVYRGRDELLGRPTAVKMLHPQLSADKDIVGRFFNEARAAAALRHIGIIEVYSFGYHSNGAAYLVMELLEGESLEARVEARGKLPLADALRITSGICSALAAAHDKQIIHRDLKPDNVYLVPDPDFVGGERIKLLDFGVAKLSGDTPAGLATRTGAVFGTPEYMAPEQCRGAANVDARADLYAVGCILFRMLCGRVPFSGGVGDVIAAQMRDDPGRPRDIDPSIPADVEAIISRLLAKAPADRFASAGALRHALGQIDIGAEAAVTPTVMELENAPRSSDTPAPSSTTLGSAAGEARAVGPAPSSASVRSRTPLYVAGALALSGVAAAIAVVTLGGGSEPGPEPEPAADPACESGDACAALARSHELGGDAALDYGRAAELYNEACDRGSAAACTRLGQFYMNAIGVRYDRERAIVLWRRACTDDVTDACADLGPELQGALAGVADFFRRGCDTEHAAACLEQSRLPASSPEDATRLREKALVLARERCEAGDVAACSTMGRAFGADTPREEEQALATMACERGQPFGCIVVPELREKGIELASKACEAGNSQMCWNLGQLHWDDGPLEKDPRRAVELYWRACDRGHPRACVGLWTIRSATKIDIDATRLSETCDRAAAACLQGGIAHTLTGDTEVAAAYLARGCEGGSADACELAVDVYSKGEGVARDIARAEGLGERWLEIQSALCRDDIVRGCRGLGQLRARRGESNEAIDAFEKACAARDRAACQDLERSRKP